ncbi:hypothetical protein AYJ08_07430 [Brevibacillus sp. SKDU10]|uniref:RNA polymerase sigma factor n=1 Tax=Brevibacillus sp. SKDU10 TaxID=1247872 RepID=UPI0007C89179|nr:sigma-70 family RNA polymerase sigma factor [Brevibacillus sp. SKDU10]OAJ74801.1 hypothetical protein AYJ08_07430 [Brevibacillus sp. SKDU10]
MQDDHELIERVLQGDKEAYTQIFDRYKARIYTFLYRMVGHPQDAQDLTQEVFIKTYYQIHSYKPQHSFSAWLYRIAANHYLQ